MSHPNPDPTTINAPETAAQTTTFSVIIPVESHRGQMSHCLEDWIRKHAYPRSLYEVVVVAPDDLSAAEIKELKTLLSARDRLILRPEKHDVPLCVAGAEEATGEILFFTESHCWPEPDVLAQVAAALQSHPEWAGLSCASVPVTHNRLSVAEAAMYEADIQHGMLHHPWLKVLDQCFAVRKDAYFQAGGFDAALGHFAEWMFGARFSRMEMSLGYLPQARVHHFYVGEMGELKEFTNDFVNGELLMQTRLPRDPCADMLPQVPEWTGRHQWDRPLAAAMVKVLCKELARRRKSRRTIAVYKGILAGIAHWAPAATGGATPAWAIAILRAWARRAGLWWSTHFGRREALKEAFLAYIEAWVRVCRLRFIIDHPRSGRTEGQPANLDSKTGSWEPGDTNETLTSAGFHLPEVWDGKRFRWSEPAAVLEIPAGAGIIKVTIDFLGILPGTFFSGVRFYVNEEPVPGESVRWNDCGVELRFGGGANGSRRLAWCSPRVDAPGDERRLGLPVCRVAWEPVSGDRG